MRLISTALFFVSLGLTGCAPERADSGPSYPGWALEADAAGDDFLLEASDVHQWVLQIDESGTPCADCTVEQQAQLAVHLDVQAVDAPAKMKVALVGHGLRVEREVSVQTEDAVLLVGPIYQGCSTAPRCSEQLQLELVADAPVRGTWSATVRAESTHDAEKWTPNAKLDVRVR